MKVLVEYTDTFNGEANYSWVKRRTIQLDGSASDRQVFIKAKKLMGLYGVRGAKLDTGDCISFRPYGMNTVMYVVYDGEDV
jgi:hypothetical protein